MCCTRKQNHPLSRSYAKARASTNDSKNMGLRKGQITSHDSTEDDRPRRSKQRHHRQSRARLFTTQPSARALVQSESPSPRPQLLRKRHHQSRQQQHAVSFTAKTEPDHTKLFSQETETSSSTTTATPPHRNTRKRRTRTRTRTRNITPLSPTPPNPPPLPLNLPNPPPNPRPLFPQRNAHNLLHLLFARLRKRNRRARSPELRHRRSTKMENLETQGSGTGDEGLAGSRRCDGLWRRWGVSGGVFAL